MDLVTIPDEVELVRRSDEGVLEASWDASLFTTPLVTFAPTKLLEMGLTYT